MVIKFCYNNEIHRCSEPPADLQALRSYLISSFHVELPQNFTLSFADPDNGNTVFVSSPQDYQNLLNLQASKTVKIFLGAPSQNDTKTSPEAHDEDGYSVINRKKSSEDIEEKKDSDNLQQEKPSLEKLVENLSESTIVPQVEQKYAYFNYTSQQDENIKKLVRDTVQEQLPFIIDQVKAAVLAEVRNLIPKPQIIEVKSYEKPQVQPERKVIYLDAEEIEEKKADQVKIEADLEKDIYKIQEQPVEREIIEKPPKKNFFKQIKQLGNAVKDQIDDLAQKVTGDPYIQISEGKYAKSVVEKVDKLKEVFVEEDRKTLLDFVAKYPRDVNVQQLAHLWMFKDEPAQEEPAPVDDENKRRKSIENDCIID